MKLTSLEIFEDFPGGPVTKTPPSNARNEGLIPGQGTKVPQAMWCSQKIKNKETERKGDWGLAGLAGL